MVLRKAMFHQRSRSLTRTGLRTTHTRGSPLFPVGCMLGAYVPKSALRAERVMAWGVGGDL